MHVEHGKSPNKLAKECKSLWIAACFASWTYDCHISCLMKICGKVQNRSQLLLELDKEMSLDWTQLKKTRRINRESRTTLETTRNTKTWRPRKTWRRFVEEEIGEKLKTLRERWRSCQTTEQNGKTSHQPYAPKGAWWWRECMTACEYIYHFFV
jgi:hypothetical protein